MSESKPQSFKYYGVDVYNLDELIDFDPAYFYGCLKRKRNVITKKNISPSDYYYAKNNGNGWMVSHEKYNQAKILIKSNWVQSNVTKFLGQYKPCEELPLLMAPPVLELEDWEKFRDDEGNIFEVEVRGLRETSQVYFRALDIESMLEMDNLVKRLKQTHYSLEEDYILFLVDNSCTRTSRQSSSGSFESKRIRRTFLTYSGLLKLIFRSQSKIAYQFRKWATSIIYTSHIGTDEQRFDQALEIGRANYTLTEL